MKDKYKTFDWFHIKNEIPELAEKYPPSHLIGKNDIAPIITIVEKSNTVKGYNFIQLFSINNSAIFLFKKKTFLQNLFSW